RRGSRRRNCRNWPRAWPPCRVSGCAGSWPCRPRPRTWRPSAAPSAPCASVSSGSGRRASSWTLCPWARRRTCARRWRKALPWCASARGFSVRGRRSREHREQDMDSVIAFIGCGNMGSSLIGGLIADGVSPGRLRGADTDPAQCERVRERFGIAAGTDSTAAASGAQVVVLAVKPQVARATVTGMAEVLRRERPVLLSIAAGIRLESLRAWVGADIPMVRAMPNTPALIRAGAAALYAGPGTKEEHRERAESILRAVGAVVWLDDEDLMDAVTALSGSGPAYFFRMIEALEEAAVELGLS